MTIKTLYTPKEIIAENGGPLPLALSTVYKFCKEEKIPSIKIGSKVFIPAKFIQKLIEQHS